MRRVYCRAEDGRWKKSLLNASQISMRFPFTHRSSTGAHAYIYFTKKSNSYMNHYSALGFAPRRLFDFATAALDFSNDAFLASFGCHPAFFNASSCASSVLLTPSVAATTTRFPSTVYTTVGFPGQLQNNQSSEESIQQYHATMSDVNAGLHAHMYATTEPYFVCS